MLRVFGWRAWPTKLLVRYAAAAFVTIVILTSLQRYHAKNGGSLAAILFGHREATFNFPLDGNSHPIDLLILEAKNKQDALLLRRSHNLSAAAARYRERRGRHPPPGFDRWVEHALQTGSVLVEEFYDRIYHDLSPYWALDTNVLKSRANSWHHVVRVRAGNATADGNTKGMVEWLQLWTDLVKEMAEHLPDVDMPINYMDESRILMPYEEVAKYVGKEQKMRHLLPAENVVKSYKKGLADVDAKRKEPYEPHWMGGSRKYWDYTRVTCPPGSPSRDVPAMTKFNLPPSIPYNWEPSYTYKGYVQNFTEAMDPCTQPHLRSLHGTFIEPISISTTTELVPLFGGSKLPNNNEILLPGAMYLSNDDRYSGGRGHGPPWGYKKTGIIWRGVASGGRNQEDNWTHFHRHRLVEMLNGTTVQSMEANGVRALTFEMPPIERYTFPRRRAHAIGKWLQDFADVGFTELNCFPGGDPETQCDYVRDHFSPIEAKTMVEQFAYKFLPDVDGNSFSARFRGFILSTSLPLKATVYAEWHDDRLVPWLHFVPLDNTFQDLYGILDYFTDGPEDSKSWWKRTRKGGMAAQWIAEQGKKWGETVLRREDMRLYVWRLLLEWARICDDERESLGFVDDLIGAKGA